MDRTPRSPLHHGPKLVRAQLRAGGLTIRSKIFSAFLLLAMITGCLGAYAVHSIGITGTLVVETFDRSLMSNDYARAALADFAGMEAALARQRFTSDPVQLAALADRIDTLAISVREDVQIAADRSMSPYAASTAHEAQAALAAWEAAYRQTAQTDGGRSDRDWLELDRHAASINERLDVLVNHTASGGFMHRQRAMAMIRQSTYLNVAGTALVLMLGAIIAFQLTRRIMGPVRAASAAARRIASGELDTGIPAASSDELGALLQAMDIMRNNIRVMVAREVAQRRSAQVLLTDAIESSCEGVLVVNAGGKVAIANRRIAEFFPCLSRIASDGASFDDAIEAAPALRAMDGGRGPAASRETCLNDGRWVQVSRSPTQEGGFVAICSDVTALKSREAELRATNLSFDAALNNMSQGLCLFDAAGCLRVTNPQYCDIYRLSPAAVAVGSSLLDLLRLQVDAGNHPGQTLADLHAAQLALLSRRAPGSLLQATSGGRTIAISVQKLADGGWVATYDDVSERHRAEAQIAFMARHDALTRLPNRVMFKERLDQAAAQLGRGIPFAVLCLGLDHFKTVNDTLGHAAGDELLVAVAARLEATIRETDTLARLGGDEFAVLQIGLNYPEDAGDLAARLLAILGAPYDVAGQLIPLSISVGAAVAPSDGADGEVLLRKAELAQFRAKMEGRNTYRFFEAEMDARLHARRTMERDLRTATAQDELELFYQPLVETRTGRVCGFEALLRWRHPIRGMISPADFIPVAEETGLIVEIGEWVIRQACLQAASWPADIKVAVNVSPIQLKTDRVVQVVRDALQQSGLPAARLEVEVTETVLLTGDGVALDLLHQIRNLGVRVSMDDFGTGYSSLSYLNSFPFDKIKIDQSFVRHLTGSKQSAAIIRAISGLGTSLGMRTTAEGVETAAQLAQVRAEDCTEIQGYYFSKPVPAGQVAELIQRIADQHSRPAPVRAYALVSGSVT